MSFFTRFILLPLLFILFISLIVFAAIKFGTTPSCTDKDNDGYGISGSSKCKYPIIDCNDNNAAINPGASEICDNGIDEDCDGYDGLCDNQTASLGGGSSGGGSSGGGGGGSSQTNLPSSETCIDNDNDGYGNPGSTNCTYSTTDCNDNNASINPGASETCDNGIDENCDGYDEVCITGRSVYVSTSGSDSYDGLYPTYQGEDHGPFRTVQKAFSTAIDDDTIFIASGTYDLGESTQNIGVSLKIIGENKDNTIIKNGRSVTFYDSLIVKNIKFTDFSYPVFKPFASSGEIIDGVIFENCIFDNVEGFILDRDSEGTLTNFRIINNEFTNIGGGGSYVIRMESGIISDIDIINNKFENIGSPSSRNTIALWLGDEGIRNTTEWINIRGNTFESILAVVGGEEENLEAHAVLVYGSHVTVSSNSVTNVTNAPDHEAIYLKASYSEISYNVIHNGGAPEYIDGGDISIKGNGNVENKIFGNRITGDYPGIGIYTKGEVNISNNYVKKHLGGMGVYSYDLSGRTIYINDNYIETKDRSIAVYSAPEGEIANNAIISYESSTIYLSNSPDINVHDNIECQGIDCSGLIPPYPTCQNQGYYCCDSCSGTSYPSYDANCEYKNGKCCALCN